ncbi:MAG TPA: type II secretion system F family protein, partial [Terriglobales bacterium]|nr:type II secretion system F family protein [Terriglobales bacterium]
MTVTWILLAAGILFVGVGIYMFFAGRSNTVKDRLEGFVTPPNRAARPLGQSGKPFDSLRQLYNSFAGAIYSEKTYRKLASANWPISVAEYVLVKAVLIIGLFSVSYWGLHQVVLAIVLPLMANFILEFMLSRAIAKRKAKFRDQLVDVLIMISSSIRAGFSLPQAIDVVSTEMTPPASDEFRRVKREVEIGISLSQALLNLSNRMEDDDLSLVVTAININIRAGGSLS